MWTTLKFVDRFPGPEDIAYVQRSKGAPLDIKIFNYSKVEDPTPWPSNEDARTSTESILSLLLPHVARWRSFYIEVSDYALMTLALEQLCQCLAAPLLKELKLYYNEVDDTSDTPFQLSKFDAIKDSEHGPFSGHFPLLTAAVLHSVPMVWSRFQLSACLTALELAYHPDVIRPSYTDLLRIFSGIPQLEELKIWESGPNGDPKDWDTTPLQLPQLRTLEFNHMDPMPTEMLVSRMNIPQLISLKLEFDDWECTSLLRALSVPQAPMEHSIFSKLEYLEMTGFSCDEDVARECCSALKRLRSLKINFDYLPREWAITLGSAPFPCPCLESLSVTHLQGSILRDILSKRQSAGLPRLGRLDMIGGNKLLAESDEEWLEHNVRRFMFHQIPTYEDSDDEGCELFSCRSDRRQINVVQYDRG